MTNRERTSTIEFRAPQERDLAGTVAMLQRVFPHWPGVDDSIDAVEHLRWKISSPAALELGESGSVIALDGERVVGAAIRIPRRMKVGNAVKIAADSVDISTDPDYQRRGVYSGIVRQHEARVKADFMFYSPGGNDVLFRVTPGAEYEQLPVRVRALYRVIDGRALARQHPGRLPGWLLAAALGGTGVLAPLLGRPLRPRSRGVVVTRAERFTDEVDALWDRASVAFDLAIERRAEYLNWRYADPRAGHFTIYLGTVDGRLEGYAVARFRPDVAILADLLVAPGRNDVARALVERVVAEARAGRRAAAVVSWLPERHPYARVFWSLGFLPRPGVVRTSFARHRPEVTGLDPLLAPTTRLHRTYGDSDLV